MTRMADLPVIISYSNIGYAHFAENLLRSINKTMTHHRVHFYCLDDEILAHLSAMAFPNITFERVNESVSKNLEAYGSQAYNKITHTKMNILRKALKQFGYIHFVDSDVVCVKEPTIEHYRKYTEFDIVFQHDAGFHSATHFHAPTLHHIWACTGNTSLRDTAGTEFMLNKISEYQGRYPNENDQECLYRFFKDTGVTDIRTVQEAKLYTYEAAEYTNGYWFDRNIGTLDSTYFFHANHVNSMSDKVRLLRKAGQWLGV